MNREEYAENHPYDGYPDEYFEEQKYICRECGKKIKEDEYAEYNDCIFHIDCLVNIFYNNPEETGEDLNNYEINDDFDLRVFASEEVMNKYRKFK